jgi:hypothetical protein
LRLFKVIFVIVALSVLALANEKPRTLPDQIANFKISLRPMEDPADALRKEKIVGFPQSLPDIADWEGSEYAASGGPRIRVEKLVLRQDAKAYELLSLFAAAAGARITPDYGTAGFARDNEIMFFKGPHLVRVRNLKGTDAASLAAVAREFGGTLDKGEADIPALVKHLPNPEEAQKNAVFLHNFRDLNTLGMQQGVLTAIDTQGNADAALATYGPSKLLIVEFNTPQLAKDNDERVIARVHELWKLGEPAPTAYRRVGNYSVMVFDAPDQQSANQLIDQIKYEQVVQWLGENPNILRQAEQHYVDTTLGVLVAVVKASGYALLACLGLGALAGALLFTRRRAQASQAAFSDAGGMLRLNLDELTPETNPARLLRDRN